MELREAIDSIATIRRQMAASEVFRGYRALPVAVSALIAAGAGALQPTIVPRPERDVAGYVALWSSVALLSIAAAGLAMFLRDRVAGRSATRPLTWIAAGQFAPCVAAAAAITAAVANFAPEAAWLLPGLWQLFFSQGVFAACRVLPRLCYAIAAFYFASGLVVLVVARGPQALSPWAMAVPFGVGQLASAFILYWTLERRDGQ